MIKTKFLIPSILFSIVVIFSCTKDIQKTEDSNIVSQNIIPGSINNEDQEKRENPDLSEDNQLIPVQIIIDRDYSIVEIQNIDIDLDMVKEQIILASPINNNKNFKLYIADYFPETDEYREVYSSAINYDNLQTASIYSEDITGDHFLEIIIRGIDYKGLQIFEIYKFISQKNDEQELYKNIFSEHVNGDLEIKRTTCNNDYKIDKLKRESFNLEIQKKNFEDEENLIVEKYKWNELSYLFELSSKDKIKISTISNDSLLKLFRGNSNDYLTFLSGPWYKTKDLNGLQTHNMNEIFQIDINDNILTFYSDSALETFYWKDQPYRFGRNGLFINEVRNFLIKSIISNVRIYIESLETIRIEIRGNRRWGGTYTRLNDNLQNVLTNRNKENYVLSNLNIKGLYKSNFIFDSPEYILNDEGIESRGIYTIFNLNNNQILEMKELNSNGLTLDTKSYKMTFDERTNDIRTIRTITLIKGDLQSRGIELENNSELHFEQIEEIVKEVKDN